MSLNQQFLDGMSRASQALWDGAGASSLKMISDAMGALSRPDSGASGEAGADRRMVSRRVSTAQGEMSYHVSAGEAALAGGRPLVVMLHGCKQTPEDFARASEMNEIAEREGFIVVYPEQSSSANSGGCWNWFAPSCQERDQGEPALIAALTKEAASEFGADPGRVYIAGLSAGAAMALIMARAYPELYGAAGCHSGLAYKSANDLSGALSAMRSGAAGAPRDDYQGTPVIIFHGDADATVSHRNAQWVFEQTAPAGEPVSTSLERGGRRCELQIIADDQGKSVAENWRVSGAGHAWSGGSSEGSYADESGPSASEEMARFFLSQGAKREPSGKTP